jgi:hypothetical protein
MPSCYKVFMRYEVIRFNMFYSVTFVLHFYSYIIIVYNYCTQLYSYYICNQWTSGINSWMNENSINSRCFYLAVVFLFVKHPHNRNKIDKYVLHCLIYSCSYKIHKYEISYTRNQAVWMINIFAKRKLKTKEQKICSKNLFRKLRTKENYFNDKQIYSHIFHVNHYGDVKCITRFIFLGNFKRYYVNLQNILWLS